MPTSLPTRTTPKPTRRDVLSRLLALAGFTALPADVALWLRCLSTRPALAAG